MKPVISIVGRPNVGKSSLFNRIIGHNKAIAAPVPGVTRDRNHGEFEYNGRVFTLVDTGGFEPATEDNMFQLVERQIRLSIDESLAVIFVLDGIDGILPHDMEIAAALRKYNKPVYYVVNKIDSSKREDELLHQFFELGGGRLYPVSALHGLGIGELLDDLFEGAAASGGPSPGDAKPHRLDTHPRKDASVAAEQDKTPGELKIAIVGKPNTGKSSITNRILDTERMIVSDIPGTTRDAVDTRFTLKDRDIVLIDTAGLRRKSRVSTKIERHSVSSAIRAVEEAHVVNLIIDAVEGISHQDGGIAHTVISRGKGLSVVVNKWDLIEDVSLQKKYEQAVRDAIPHCSFAPVIFVSAMTGKNIGKILETDARIFDRLGKQISTPALNKALEGFLRRSAIPHVKGRQIKIFYSNQVKTFPPTFVFFSNHPSLIPEHYRRYLENSLRSVFDFTGAPIRLFFRKK